MMPMPPESSVMIPASQWESFRPTLQQKYERENLTLEAVRTYMRMAHGFSASPSQYQRIFKKWGFHKNAKRKDAEEILVFAKRRKLCLSQITLKGASCHEQEKFQRVLRRYDRPGLPYSLQFLKSPSIGGDLDNAVTITPKLRPMPHIVSLPTFRLMFHLGWRLPESSTLQLPETPLTLVTTKSTSLKLSRLDTQQDALSLDSILFAHQILSQTLDNTTSRKLLSFIDEGSMDPMLRYMCRSKSYIAKAFIKNLLLDCIWYQMMWTKHKPQCKSVMQRLIRLGLDGNIILFAGRYIRLPVHTYGENVKKATLLQSAIASRLFDLATNLLQSGADVNLCGTHGRFTDYRQLRCCDMLPIVLLLEHSVEIIADEMEAMRLLTVMQKADLVCCQALCLSSVTSPHCLSWFLTKPGIDLNAPNLAQGYASGNREGPYWLSPLQSAIDQSKYETVSMLLEAGAHPFGYCLSDLEGSCITDCDQYDYNIGPDARTSKPQSSRDLATLFTSYVTMLPLSVASFRGDLVITRLLLSMGATINGCQLDLYCHKGCFSSSMQHSICQRHGDHSRCAIQVQTSLNVCDLFSFRDLAKGYWGSKKDAFTDLQPWKELSRFGHNRQLVNYSVHFGHSALQLAVVTLQEDLIHELVKYGADIEGCHGLTPLALAICIGNANLVDILLGYGADPKGCCKHGPLISPFAVAAYLNDVANMKKLMETGRISCYETSLLHECCPWEAAVRGRSYGAVSYLLRLQYSGGLVWDTGNAASLIRLAMKEAKWSLVQVFLDRWARMLTSDEICRLITQSVENADLAITARLLALGGSPEDELMLAAALRLDSEDAQHRCSFITFVFQTMSEAELGAIIGMIAKWVPERANEKALKDVIRHLNTHYSMTAAHTSVLLAVLLEDEQYDDAALCLLENGMYVERFEERNEMTGLQYAAQTGSTKLVNRLLQLGADVNAHAAVYPGDDLGAMTTLQFAVFSRQHEIVKLLLSHGADINTQGDYAVLQAATWHEAFDPKMVELLLERGADANAIGADKDCGTALQNASRQNHTGIAELLLANGACVDAPALGRFGRTALQASVEQKNHTLSRLFLNNGADVNAPPAPRCGVTALQAAAIVGDFEMCHTLVAAGANVDADGSAEKGRTAIEGAAEYGRLDILSWLLEILVDQYRGQDPERLKASITRAKELAGDNYQDYIVQYLEDFEGTLDQRLSEIMS